jgi:hypothetical protein
LRVARERLRQSKSVAGRPVLALVGNLRRIGAGTSCRPGTYSDASRNTNNSFSSDREFSIVITSSTPPVLHLADDAPVHHGLRRFRPCRPEVQLHLPGRLPLERQHGQRHAHRHHSPRRLALHSLHNARPLHGRHLEPAEGDIGEGRRRRGKGQGYSLRGWAGLVPRGEKVVGNCALGLCRRAFDACAGARSHDQPRALRFVHIQPRVHFSVLLRLTFLAFIVVLLRTCLQSGFLLELAEGGVL